MHGTIICIGFLPLVLVIGDVVQVRPCSGNQPVPREVRVVDCSSMPCKVIKGQDINTEVDFQAPYDTGSLKVRAVPIAFGMELPYELPPEYARACDWLIGSSCPISEGDDVTYNLRIPIQKIYPRIRLAIELSLIDEQERTHACFQMDIRVVGLL